LLAFFAAQKAFNLADNLALVAGLILFFLAAAAGLTECVADLARRKFAHLVFCAAAIFLFTEALMVRFFFGAAPDLADIPRILRSSLLRASIRSLIAAARLSWLIVRSDKFMGIFINIQSWWKSSAGQRLLPGDDAYRRHLNKSSPDDRLAKSSDPARRQIPSEEVVPLATISPRRFRCDYSLFHHTNNQNNATTTKKRLTRMRLVESTPFVPSSQNLAHSHNSAKMKARKLNVVPAKLRGAFERGALVFTHGNSSLARKIDSWMAVQRW
jgi:hypothetical protein